MTNDVVLPETMAPETVVDETPLTEQESDAGLDLRQLRELVGLVDYDASADPFPVTGWDASVFVVGKATQGAP